MRETTKAVLELEDGTIYEGKSFGYRRPCAGEVVFNTAMTGYPESLTDPSYEGQILVTTFPLLGNYGVPPKTVTDGIEDYMESDRIHCEAIICQDYSWAYSHWLAERSLADWLADERIPGIYGIDTRALTKRLREKGSMLGRITFEGGESVAFVDPNKENLIAKVSCASPVEYGSGDKTVVLVDCGVKNNIIRSLVNMGNQLLAKAAGAKTYKLKYGHRSHNQPVRMVGTDKCFITSQNHGFAVDNGTLPADWEPLFINMNDGTNEGIRHKQKPFFSAQFHPEACGGPLDTDFIFDDFINML